MAFWWQGKPSNLPELFYSALLHKEQISWNTGQRRHYFKDKALDTVVSCVPVRIKSGEAGANIVYLEAQT